MSLTFIEKSHHVFIFTFISIKTLLLLLFFHLNHDLLYSGIYLIQPNWCFIKVANQKKIKKIKMWEKEF